MTELSSILSCQFQEIPERADAHCTLHIVNTYAYHASNHQQDLQIKQIQHLKRSEERSTHCVIRNDRQARVKKRPASCTRWPGGAGPSPGSSARRRRPARGVGCAPGRRERDGRRPLRARGAGAAARTSRHRPLAWRRDTPPRQVTSRFAERPDRSAHLHFTRRTPGPHGESASRNARLGASHSALRAVARLPLLAGPVEIASPWTPRPPFIGYAVAKLVVLSRSRVDGLAKQEHRISRKGLPNKATDSEIGPRILRCLNLQLDKRPCSRKSHSTL